MYFLINICFSIEPGYLKVIHSNDPLTLYLTPVGRSYTCTLPKEIKLLGEKKTTRVLITLNRVKIQPFASMTRRQYGKGQSVSLWLCGSISYFTSQLQST